MRLLLAALILLLTGCAQMAPYTPVINAMLVKASEFAVERAGKELGEVPTECEFDYNEKTGVLVLLCEARLGDE